MGKFSRLGNDLYSGKKSINFVGRKWLWYSISAVIVLMCVLGLYLKGLNMGIEFVGGAQYRVTLENGTVDQDDADAVREAVAGTGIEGAAAPIVITSGESSIIVQTKQLNTAESQEVVATIQEAVNASAGEMSQEEIGASWGQDVAKRSLTGLIVFLILVVLFIWAYFREWKMSVAAIVALAHDVVITVGIYAVSGFEVSPATVTGLLTILGFSLYDTVVVFDKVRENTKNLRSKRMTYAEAANLAVNQTLVRSINTSIVALIPVGAILYVGAFQLGNGSLKDLALALFVGMAAGTYSSIFIATPLLVHMKQGESANKAIEKRLASKRRHEADRYASVPVFTDDMAVPAGDGDDDDDETRRRGRRRARRGARDAARRRDRSRPAAGASYPRRSGPSVPAPRPGVSNRRASRGPSEARSRPSRDRP